MTVLTEEAWKMLLSGGSSVGNAGVVAVILLVGTSHCAIMVSMTDQNDTLEKEGSQLSRSSEG